MFDVNLGYYIWRCCKSWIINAKLYVCC